MRVTHVNLAGGFRGGERQTELLIEALRGRQVSQRLVCRRGGELEARVRPGERLEVRGVRWPYLPFIKAVGHPDLIHVHEGKATAFSGLAAWRRGVPYLITRRIHPTPRPSRVNRAVYGGAAALVGLSDGVREALAEWSGRDDVRVIPSASAGFVPDADEVRRIRRRFASRFLAVCAAALEEGQKGQSVLIEAARRLEPAHPELTVLLLGRGASEAALREAAQGLESVVFGGFVENLGDYLAAADLFVLPSNHEGLGSVLLDAFAAGLPVVATRIPGVVDVVRDGIEGILVPPRNPQALATAIARVMDDGGLRARLAEGARRRAGEYTAEVMADRYVALYEEILEARTKHSTEGAIP